MSDHSESEATLSAGEVWRTWLPLAASWLLMGAELPLLSAVVARLADPEINLAAYGGVVFPVALIIESPIIMLLAASTALSRDWASYQKLRRFMLWAGGGLTALHILVAFTPVYYFVARDLIGAPEEIIEPARIGLMFMTPWTWAIASRRFHQGVLIRFGRSNAVGIGTLIRLAADAAVLFAGFAIQTIPGIIVATSAVSTGVLCEALYAWFKVRPVLRDRVQRAAPVEPALTNAALFQFYLPLALTAFITLFAQPMVTAAISRMPYAVESLAVWPALNGLVFMVRALGLAYNEVVVALMGRPGAYETMRRFTIRLTLMLTALLLLLIATPLSRFWFERVAGLAPSLAELGAQAIWITVFMPGLGVVASWYQGILVHCRRTRAITESVVLFLGGCGAILVAGVLWGESSGLFVALLAMTIGGAAQTAWQAWRTKGHVRELKNASHASAMRSPAALGSVEWEG